MEWVTWAVVWVVSAVLMAVANCYAAGHGNETLRDHFAKDAVIASIVAGPIGMGIVIALGVLLGTFIAAEASYTYIRGLRPAKAACALISKPFLFAYKVGARKHQPQLPEARIR